MSRLEDNSIAVKDFMDKLDKEELTEEDIAYMDKIQKDNPHWEEFKRDYVTSGRRKKNGSN